MSAATRWRTQLEARAIPASILAAAPASPHGFSVEVFSRIADDMLAGPLDPSARRADEALPDGGAVLDVGCGAGSAGLPLAPRAARVTGVDESPGLLDAFAARAEGLGVAHVEINGRWPDVAGAVPVADVVVCRHVAHNVPDLDPFLRRLTDHARRRVVLHLPVDHPLAWMAPYWDRLHDVVVPDGPTLADAVDVAAEAGIDVELDRWDEPFDLANGTDDEQLAFLRRRLCLSDDREHELRAALADVGVPALRPVATLWWEGTAR